MCRGPHFQQAAAVVAAARPGESSAGEFVDPAKTVGRGQRLALAFREVSGRERALHVNIRASGAISVESDAFLSCLEVIARDLGISFGEILASDFNSLEGLHRLLLGEQYVPRSKTRRVPLNERRYLSTPARAMAMRERLSVSISRGYITLPPTSGELRESAALLEEGVHVPSPSQRVRTPRPWPDPDELLRARHPRLGPHGGQQPSAGGESPAAKRPRSSTRTPPTPRPRSRGAPAWAGPSSGDAHVPCSRAPSRPHPRSHRPLRPPPMCVATPRPRRTLGRAMLRLGGPRSHAPRPLTRR
eukprot:tig00000237_g20467.t1